LALLFLMLLKLWTHTRWMRVLRIGSLTLSSSCL
jgi:hypothetical protein